jgi:phosphocarrier protein FPr
MIGILIISHSADIARGVKSLADQMAKGQVLIAAAGGTIEGDLGTSTDQIAAALAELQGVEAVLALVDMGSAVMSAEMALEISGLPHRISAAPLVEGALVAAIEASRPGISLDALAAAAERALEAKGIAPVATPPAPAPPAPAASSPALAPGRAEAEFTITNKNGLHMRPAKDFVRAATSFTSTVRVRNLDRAGQPEANAKSPIEVLKIAVRPGQRVRVMAEGADAQAAVDALRDLAAANFGEEPAAG